MNFGDLLFALNCDRLKNDIRKIEKINKRIVQSKNGIYFNDIDIYIYILLFVLYIFHLSYIFFICHIYHYIFHYIGGHAMVI